MKPYLPSTLCLLFALSGCDELLQKQDTKKPEPSPVLPTAYQRFVPIVPAPSGYAPMRVPWHGFFALDTKTGTLCRTVDRAFPSDSAWANELALCTTLTIAGLPEGGIVKPIPRTKRFVHGDDVWDIPLDKVEAFKKKHPEAVEKNESDEEIMERLNKKYGAPK